MASVTRVLVVDDSAVARASIRKLLDDAGFETHELPGAVGVTREIVRKNIDVVVLDINMPMMRGHSIVKLMRASDRLKDVKVLLVTGESLPDAEQRARDSGADGLMKKGDVRAQLVAEVTRLAKAREQREP